MYPALVREASATMEENRPWPLLISRYDMGEIVCGHAGEKADDRADDRHQQEREPVHAVVVTWNFPRGRGKAR